MLKNQRGGDGYEIYGINNIAKENIDMKAFSNYKKKVLYEKYDEREGKYVAKYTIEERIFNSERKPGLLFLETIFTSKRINDEGENKTEFSYACRTNDLTDEEITNTKDPGIHFRGDKKNEIFKGKYDFDKIEKILQK